MIRVLLVGSDERVRSLLRWVLGEDGGFAVVGETADEHDAVGWPEPYDVALIEIGLSGLEGTGLLAALHRREPPPAVVVLSPSGAPYLRDAAAAQGAEGFLVGSEDAGCLADGLRAAIGAGGRPRP